MIIRIALIPLFVKQIKSSRSMQLLQPQVRELQKKYGHDREKLGQETMKLYKDNNANPLSSCLPLLLQMPIFLALFRVLDGAARTDDAGHPHTRGYWLQQNPDLVESLNQATIFGARISDTFLKVPLTDGITSVHVVTVVLIIAMTVTLFITQLQLMRKNMPPEALTGPFAQQQKIMLYVVPADLRGRRHQLPGRRAHLLVHLQPVDDGSAVLRHPPQPGARARPAYDAWEDRRKARQKRRGGTEEREGGEEPEAGGQRGQAVGAGARRGRCGGRRGSAPGGSAAAA